MLKVDEIKNDIIGKILSISNEDFLEALDKLIDSSIKNGKARNKLDPHLLSPKRLNLIL
jgi:hypothetical protein